MADDKKSTDDLVNKDPKTDEEKPASADTATTSSDEPTPAGTDQQGRQLYNVKCSKCNKDTQVPFKPSGDRPVYCRDCYMAQRKERGSY